MSGLPSACACGTCSSCTAPPPRPAVADPLVYRHGAIKARMLERIASTSFGGERPLAALTTRDGADPAIALIDAVAGSLHILAYSAARLSDDGSILRTQDRDALVNLTRMLGYEPRPALSAATTLSFTVNKLEGGPTEATVPAGTKVASVPGQDEKPQTFETEADLDARAEWNALRPVMPKTVPDVGAGTTALTIAGTGTAAKVGDLVLAYLSPQPAGGPSWLAGRISAVTRLSDPELPPQTILDLSSTATLASISNQTGPAFENRVIVLAQRAAAFGATAPNVQLLGGAIPSAAIDTTPTPDDWAGLEMRVNGSASSGPIDLDAVYPEAMADRFIFFETDEGTPRKQIGRIVEVIERSRTDFGLSAKVSRVTLEGIDLSDGDPGFNEKVRGTGIFLETGRETLLVEDADVPLPGAPYDRLTVAGEVALPAGRRIVLTGKEWESDAPLVKVATVKSAAASGGSTELVFDGPIAGRFRSRSLSLLGNSIAATHGETPASGPEIVGSSTPTRLSPRYQLKASPLTYVPAVNSRGYAPAIQVRVSDRLYEEVPRLWGLDPATRAYTVRTVADEKSELQFAGRLPSGVNSVTAWYRVGSGTAGNLGAGRLTTMMTPVLGITGASNPVPAEGGSDAETIEEMRASAPQSIRTLDRVVSLSDYEVFARRYAGIGKALATELQAGMRRIVCVTVATSGLAPPVAGSATVENLRAALALAGVPGRAVRIEGFEELNARVAIAFAADASFVRDAVAAAIRSALGERFGREARGFGQGLHESEILAAVQQVEGVIAARIVSLEIADGEGAVDGRLLSPAPALTGGTFTPAGLLSIDPGDIAFQEMVP